MAAALGDDADTVAAVTGALAGAYYGDDAIPAEWRSALKDNIHIHETALALAGKSDAAATRTSRFDHE